MAELGILFGWPRSGTQHIGRCLSICDGVEWHGEILRREAHPSITFGRWLRNARKSTAKWCVAKILPDHLSGWEARDCIEAAHFSGASVAWAGREKWEDCVSSMERAHWSGAWHFPLRTWPPTRVPLPDKFRDERGLRECFQSVFPDAPESMLESFHPEEFLRKWLGLRIENSPRKLNFSQNRPDFHDLQRIEQSDYRWFDKTQQTCNNEPQAKP